MSTTTDGIYCAGRIHGEKSNVGLTVWRLSVWHFSILTVTHQGAACDAANVHFGQTISRTDILVSPAELLNESLLTSRISAAH